MEVRGRALLFAYIELGALLITLVRKLLAPDPEKPPFLTKQQEEYFDAAQKLRNLKYPIILLPLVPVGLTLVGLLKDAVCCLKWGIGLNCVLSGFGVAGVIGLIPICFVVTKTAKGDCIIDLISLTLGTVWLIWGLRVCNEYYLQITGEPPVCVCCICCCFKTNLVGTGMMGPGNIVMYSPSGQPIYGPPPGSAVQMQPSQMSPSQQQMWMQQQQQQQMMMQQQQEQ